MKRERNIFKSVCFLFCAVAIMLSPLSENAFAESPSIIAEGNCGVDNGDNVTWTLYSDGLMIIRGTGEMEYSNEMDSTLYAIADKILHVEIKNGVTVLGDYALWYCSSIENVVIPDSVTYIGDNAFRYCDGLSEIVIPNSVTGIGAYAFSGCAKLESISISDSVTSIGAGAFSGCDSLTYISVDENNQSYCNDEYGVLFNKQKTELIAYPAGDLRTEYFIPEGVRSIADSAFSSCIRLMSIIIPDSVENIGASAFEDCIFESITLPDSVVSIGDSAFWNCIFESITLPDGVISIGGSAFYNCCFEEILLPDSVKSIGHGAFSSCDNLKSISIPSSVSSIGYNPFVHCLSLESISVDVDNKSYCSDENGVLFNKDKTALIAYPAGNKNSEYKIPDGVMSIGVEAFFTCPYLQKVVMPKDVIRMEHQAFMECETLAEIYYKGSEDDWNKIEISAMSKNRIKNVSLVFAFSITQDVCAGGMITLDEDKCFEGDTVTVGAVPYYGYELVEIRVDGTKIDGNSFVVSSDHLVSAVFNKTPGYTGNEECSIGDISVFGEDGIAYQMVPQKEMRVEMPIIAQGDGQNCTVILTLYSQDGKFCGIRAATIENMSPGAENNMEFTVDNSGGNIDFMRAHVVSGISEPVPLGDAVAFGVIPE